MIQVRDINKKYGANKVLRDISFSVEDGTYVAIVGKNGGGKTTLMQILAGALKPDTGELNYFGSFPLKQKGEFRKLTGYVPQKLPLIEELSVKDNLELWQVTPKLEKYEEVLEQFDLKDLLKKRVGTLSGGMQRRLSIACAAAHSPKLLLMDEPTSALDLSYKRKILEWMEEYRTNGGIVLMTTHDEKEIMMCDRCIAIENGTLTELPRKELSIGEVLKIIEK